MKSLIYYGIAFMSLLMFSCQTNTSHYPKFNIAKTQKCVDSILTISDQLMNDGDESLGRSYMFDSINLCVIQQNIKHITFTDIENRDIRLADINTPIILIVSASWCAPCKAEIPAINQLAKDYKDRLKLIMFFQDQKEKVIGMREDYASEVILIPSTIKSEKNNWVESEGFKHFLGYPSSYFLDSDGNINLLKRGAVVPSENIPKEYADSLNYNNLEKNIAW